MNFNQWRKYAAKRDVAKITYICGAESSLVELVLQDIVDILEVPATDYCISDSKDVWDSASIYALDASINRLTVVRQAQNISDWSGLLDWLAISRSNPNNYIVFISDLDDGPSIYDKGKRVSYANHIEVIRSKGRFVKCSTPNREDMTSWCMDFGLSEASAHFVIDRLCSDTDLIYQVLKKVKVWKGSPNTNALSVLCDEQSAYSFADCVILLDKRSALMAAKSIEHQDYVKILSQLDRLLDCMMDIYRCIVRRMYDNDVAQTTGIKIYTVKKFKGVAKDYTFDKIKQRRQLLSVLDSQISSGARTGVLESLVALW